MARPEEPVTICQVCGAAISDGPLLACDACGTLHHRDCWSYAGRCSVFGCGSTHASTPAPEAEQVVLRIDEDTPVPAAAAGDRRRERTRSSPSTGRTATSERTPARAATIMQGRVKLDLTTPLEQLSTVPVALGVIASLGLGFLLMTASEAQSLDEGWVLEALVPVVLATAFFVWVRQRVDCAYYLDLEREALVYVRDLGFLSSRHVIGGFDDIHTVTVQGKRYKTKYSSWWTYRTVVVMQDGRIVPVTDTWRDSTRAADRNAASIARRTNSRYLRARSLHELVVERAGDGLIVRQERWRSMWEKYPALVVLMLALIMAYVIGMAQLTR